MKLKNITLIVVSNNNKYNFKSLIISEILLSNIPYFWCNPFSSSLTRSRRPKFFKELLKFKSWCYSIQKHAIYKNSLKLLVRIFFNIKFWLLLCKLMKIKKVEELMEIKIGKTLFGPMLYDTILRHHELNTILKFEKRFKWNLLNFAIEYCAIAILSKLYNIEAIIAADSTYTNNGGVQTRFGLTNKICVYLTSSSEFFVQPEDALIIAARNYFDYNNIITINDSIYKDFQDFKLKKFNIQNFRDETLPYMRVSAYSKNCNNVSLIPNSVVIFLHDFYDAFHYTNIEMFKDYYSWLNEILQKINFIKSKNIFYFKPHPNSNIKCLNEAKKLIKSYNNENIQLLDCNTSNSSIFDSKPQFVVSLRGNVLFEAAIFGVKCLGGNDSPYVNFNFVKNCQNNKEFFACLLGEVFFETDIIEDELISFYVQHYAVNTDLKKAESILDTYNDFNFSLDYFTKVRECKNSIEEKIKSFKHLKFN